MKTHMPNPTCFLVASFLAFVTLGLLSACSGNAVKMAQEVKEGPWWFQDAELSSRVIHVAPEDSASKEPEEGSKDKPLRGLQKAVNLAKSGDLLILKAGTYDLKTSTYIEETVGNAKDEDYRAKIPVSVGLSITRKALTIVGENRAKTIIKTNANYGLHFDHAGRSKLRNLTITGGIRGKDGRSTDAAVLARYSWVKLENCSILNNSAKSKGAADYPGVIGVCGREGAELVISGCVIKGNSWDGVALYRSDPDVPNSEARALVEDTEISHGKGVGVGATWDSMVVVSRCKIHDYWKGIGSFGTSRALVYNCAVFSQKGWGIVASGQSFMEASNNVVFGNGTTGMAAWNERVRGIFRNNVIAENGKAEKEWVGKKCGLWLNSKLVQVGNNCFWNNASFSVCAGGVPGGEQAKEIKVGDLRACFESDPKFTNAAKGDFRPKKGSPLIKKGDAGVRFAMTKEVDIGLSTPIRFESAGELRRKSHADQWLND